MPIVEIIEYPSRIRFEMTKSRITIPVARMAGSLCLVFGQVDEIYQGA